MSATAVPTVFDVELFNQEVDASKALLETVQAATDLSGNHAIFLVKTTDMRATFKFQVDSSDVEHVLNSPTDDINYYTEVSGIWHQPSADSANNSLINLNAANASLSHEMEAFVSAVSDISGLPLSLGRIVGASTSGVNYNADKLLLKHDFMRRLSNTLFNTPHFVDMFSNENTMLEDLASKLEAQYESKVYDQIVAANNMNDTNDASNNLSREFIRRLLNEDPARFYVDTSGTINGAERENIAAKAADGITDISLDVMRPVPFVDGDSFEFKVTINEDAGQRNIDGISTSQISGSSAYVYTIKVVCVSDSDATANTTVPTDKKGDDATGVASDYNTQVPYAS